MTPQLDLYYSRKPYALVNTDGGIYPARIVASFRTEGTLWHVVDWNIEGTSFEVVDYTEVEPGHFATLEDAEAAGVRMSRIVHLLRQDASDDYFERTRGPLNY
jgi:hypothetical protein